MMVCGVLQTRHLLGSDLPPPSPSAAISELRCIPNKDLGRTGPHSGRAACKALCYAPGRPRWAGVPSSAGSHLACLIWVRGQSCSGWLSCLWYLTQWEPCSYPVPRHTGSRQNINDMQLP